MSGLALVIFSALIPSPLQRWTATSLYHKTVIFVPKLYTTDSTDEYEQMPCPYKLSSRA